MSAATPEALKALLDVGQSLDALPADARQPFADLRDRWHALAALIEEKDGESRAISRRIGEARKAGSDASALIAEKRHYSEQLDALQQERDALLETLQALCLPANDVGAETACDSLRYPRPDARAEGLEIGPVGDAESDWQRWQAYVDGHPAARQCHDPRWHRVMTATMGQEARYLWACEPSGNVCGVLPLVRLDSPLFGNFMVSLPYLNYGGPLADSPAIETALMQQAGALAQSLGCRHAEFRDVEPREGWPARTDKAALWLSLPADESALWEALGTKLRAQIKRGQREAPQVAVGGMELLDDFYTVFARNMRDLGTPVYSRALFRDILAAFPGQAYLVVVSLGGRPVSAAFLLGHRDVLEIPWASTLREVNPLGMNMVLYWEVLRSAIARGYRWFDFGRSTRDAGTYKFKLQWGAEPRPLHWHYWLPAGQALPKLNPDNPKFKLLIAIWQRLPVWLTRLIGPPVVRHLP